MAFRSLKLIVVVLFLLTQHVFAQSYQEIDSCKRALPKCVDFEKINLQNRLAELYLNFSTDSAIEYATQAFLSAQVGEYQFQQALSLLYLGKARNNKEDFSTALADLRNAEQIFKELQLSEPDNNEYTRQLANAIQNIGVVYYSQAKYDSALECYIIALKNFEEINYQHGIAKVYNNMGVLYESMENYDKAADYYTKSLIIHQNTSYFKGIASSFNNLGNINFTLGKYAAALQNFQLSLNIKLDIGDKRAISASYNNIGNCYLRQKNYDTALYYLEKSLTIETELNNKVGISASLENIGSFYFEIGKYEKALEYYFKSLKFANETRYLPQVISSYKNISDLYSVQGNYQQAYEYLKKYETEKYSFLNLRNFQHISELEKKYLLSQEMKLNNERLQNKQTIIYYLILISVLFVVLISVIYNRLRVKRKANDLLVIQNEEINRQKEEITAQRDEIQKQNCFVIEQRDRIERQNRSIMDSINYASYIQRAVLPAVDFLENLISDYFIIYKPRDVVSGDFYWMSQKQDTIFVAAADCTGHGVPGGFLSMLGTAYLNEIVSRKSQFTAAEILNSLQEKISKSLHQTDRTDIMQDGIDIALIIIETDTLQMQYAGSNRPLYIVRNTILNTESEIPDSVELLEIKADVVIGIQMRNDNGYTNHNLQLWKDDAIYLFSDGFVDQFNESSKQKFKPYRLKNLLQQVYPLALIEQKYLLEKRFESWKGNSEQIDDILLIGIRV